MSRYLKSQQKLIDAAFTGAAAQRRVPAQRVAAKRQTRNTARRGKA